MNPELKKAWDDVLFWAKRLTYHSADNHSEWREKYETAKKHRDEVKARLDEQRNH